MGKSSIFDFFLVKRVIHLKFLRTFAGVWIRKQYTHAENIIKISFETKKVISIHIVVYLEVSTSIVSDKKIFENCILKTFS